jgi:hypothetical protein
MLLWNSLSIVKWHKRRKLFRAFVFCTGRTQEHYSPCHDVFERLAHSIPDVHPIRAPKANHCSKKWPNFVAFSLRIADSYSFAVRMNVFDSIVRDELNARKFRSICERRPIWCFAAQEERQTTDAVIGKLIGEEQCDLARGASTSMTLLLLEVGFRKHMKGYRPVLLLEAVNTRSQQFISNSPYKVPLPQNAIT